MRFGKTGALVREVAGQVVMLPRLQAATDALLEHYGLSFGDALGAMEQLGWRHTSRTAN